MNTLSVFDRIESTIAGQLAIIAEDEAHRQCEGIDARYSGGGSHYDAASDQWIARGGLANTERAVYTRKVKDKATGRVRIVRVKPKPLTENDRARIAAGLTRQDVTACQKALKAIGVTLSEAETIGAMVEVQARGWSKPPRAGGRPRIYTEAERREKNRLKTAAYRAKMRANGICIVCLVNPADTECSTCWECGRKANARKKRLH